MKKYYIKAKPGYSDSLLHLIQHHLLLSEQETRTLISIGAVWNWDIKRRLKNPEQNISDELIVVHKPNFEVKPYPFDAEDIVYEDKHFLIVYKKPGYPTVPSPLNDISCLSFALEQYYQSEKKGTKISAINRLDTGTQGLVFFGKNKEADRALHRMFKERRVKKWYLAGTESFQHVKRNYFLEDDLEWKDKKKRAKTFIHLLKKNSRGFCFLVRPHTGRTHQIRKHFASYLVPIRGDSMYGNYRRDEPLELVCFAYIFPHPITGKRMKVMYLPEDEKWK
jgi:23S rRNA-/tRNA-specific pseudouridylate synthase